jgi:nitrate/TMAO reductase-like tetraheme cytochrome c subunit
MTDPAPVSTGPTTAAEPPTASPPGPPDEPAPAAEAPTPAAASLPAPGGRLAFLRPRRPGWTRRFGFSSRRGKLVLFILVAGFGAMMTVGSVAALQWTETADFCGRCHTMGPELKGHEISVHRELACAECHVEPGIEGWVKAKINGTKQLIQVLTGTYPTPIPPPGHGDLPPTSETCRRCHDVAPLIANGGPVKLVMTTRFLLDESNTRQSVALVMRPAGLGGSTDTRGVHWHIASDVEFTSADPRSQTIDMVQVTDPDGTKSTYIAMGQVGNATNVQPDIDRLLAGEKTARMDCTDCHNRAGHNVPTVDQAVDDAMEQGAIDPSLPYVKAQSVARLSANYDTTAAAGQAIEDLRGYYSSQYPLIAVTKAAAINTAISELEQIYELVATPDMKVTAATYPDNLGHTAYPGCFRCHDGGHYKVVGGALTSEAIPSACATCHTFPQIGPNTSAILIGQRPASHDDKLWVFNHKTQVTSVDPSTASCGVCHTRTYCENCHNTSAVQVPHDDMVFNHAAVIRKVGAQACVFCHQASYCAQCHPGSVLPSPGAVLPSQGPSPSSPGADLPSPGAFLASPGTYLLSPAPIASP